MLQGLAGALSTYGSVSRTGTNYSANTTVIKKSVSDKSVEAFEINAFPSYSGYSKK
jgi:hypothetical protein